MAYKGKCGRNPTPPSSQQNSLMLVSPFRIPSSRSSKTLTWKGGTTGLFKKPRQPSSGTRTDAFTSHYTFYREQLTDEHIHNCLNTFTSRLQRKPDNLYWNADTSPVAENYPCVECSQPDATTECITHLERMGCQGFVHNTRVSSGLPGHSPLHLTHTWL